MAAIDLSDIKPNPEDRQPIEVEAAFMVIIRGNGIIQASPDINAPVVPQREVTLDEMQMASRRVYDDIQATKVANVVQMSVQQAASQAAQQADAQRLAQSLRL
ncbi:hypothetical protein [Streptomyces luteogriseus]|uniref:hypothetical protein n=1 Tax=Streptomyces luteogriseus TaxID=68233 RepID=UPI0037B38F21